MTELLFTKKQFRSAYGRKIFVFVPADRSYAKKRNGVKMPSMCLVLYSQFASTSLYDTLCYDGQLLVKVMDGW